MLTSDLVLLLASAVIFGACLGAAWTDVLRRRIPNRLILLLALGAPLLVLGGHMPTGDFAGALSLSLALFLLGSQLFARGWIGGGDVKLICALTLWFPPGQGVWFVCLALMFGGVLALIVLGLQVAVRRDLIPVGATQRRLLLDTLSVPYGVSIGGAAAVQFAIVWL